MEKVTPTIGADFPKNMQEGEVFRLLGNPYLPNGLYILEAGQHVPLVSEYPSLEVGTTKDTDINVNSGVVIPVTWDRIYTITDSAYEVIGPSIKIKTSGSYEVYYNISISCFNKSGLSVEVFTRLSTGYRFNRSKSYPTVIPEGRYKSKSSSSLRFNTQLSAGEELQLCARKLSLDSDAFTVTDNCSLCVRRVGK